jgi:site-specific recombinase XerD
MTGPQLRDALAEYLRLRRALGYQLVRPEQLLNQFLTYLDHSATTTITVDQALSWARQSNGDPNWWAYRLSVVRGFATYLRTLDPTHEVPAADLLPRRVRRAHPHLYSDDDVDALIAATQSLGTPMRRATYATLIGLLAVEATKTLGCKGF